MSKLPLKMDLLNVPKIQKMNAPMSSLMGDSSDEIGLGYHHTLVSTRFEIQTFMLKSLKC